MSGSRRSVGPVRQLSLQQPAPRRQQIRRQRSAEDDKSLQIYANPIARGRHGANSKSGTERPKVRVAWSENRRKNEDRDEQVEVVARQIPGRSRPATGKLRGFGTGEKPSILYSRQELAERLRLAWKHRQENKANIDIFLARGTVEERCESELSNYAVISAPSTPLPKRDASRFENLPSSDDVRSDGSRKGSIEEDSTTTVSIRSDSKLCDFGKDGEREASLISEYSRVYVRERGAGNAEETEKGNVESDEEEEIDNVLVVKDKTSINIDCPNLLARSTILPSIKVENTTQSQTKTSDLFSAKRKRASFHSGANRAFLGPVKSPTEIQCNAITDKIISQKSTASGKSDAVVEKTATARTIGDNKDNPFNDKIPPLKDTPQAGCNSAGENISLQKPIIRCNSLSGGATIKRNAIVQGDTSVVVQNEDDLTNEKIAFPRSVSEVKCNSAAERNASSRKLPEARKTDQKSRRTSSAPPQRQLGHDSSCNRLRVNIVIDAPSAVASAEKSSVKENCQGKVEADNDNGSENTDTIVTKVSCGRPVRSASLKRRSKSTKRRFWGAVGSCKIDEDGKSRNRSGNRGKNLIDSKAIDVVTMVSLVSSADSDSDTENSPGDDKLINELRSKLPTTSIIKSTISSALSITRKPIKSVSFQNDSFDEELPKEQQAPPKEEKKTSQPRFAIVNNRGNVSNLSSSEEAVSWRTDIPGLALPLLALIHDVEETPDVPLTDREKRCLAVPIGDLRDKKRKLLRTRTTPSRIGTEKQPTAMETKEQELAEKLSRTESTLSENKTRVENSPRKIGERPATPAREVDQGIRLMSVEPHFQTNKEKECWHLYRRMCDKGVYVSFDTVLRGMLTPTEYRLRQKEFLQDS